MISDLSPARAVALDDLDDVQDLRVRIDEIFIVIPSTPASRDRFLALSGLKLYPSRFCSNTLLFQSPGGIGPTGRNTAFFKDRI